MYAHWNGFKGSVLHVQSEFYQHYVYIRSSLSWTGCQSEHGYLVQGGSVPVSFASLQYLSFRMNADALGCLCLVKTPFLFPITRVTPADTRGINKNLVIHRAQKQRSLLSQQYAI